MIGKYASLEQYLRQLPISEEEVALTFERIDELLKEPLPTSAREDYSWWDNQRQGPQVESNSWMDSLRSQHLEQEEYDEARTIYFKSQGYRVIRFWNNDVMNNIEGLILTIVHARGSLDKANTKFIVI